MLTLLAIGGALASGGSRADSVRLRYLPESNALRTVARFGTAATVNVSSLGDPGVIRADPRWLAAAQPLGAGAPSWAQRMYKRSLLVLHALTDRHTGAVVAGARDGWAYVWPRDASAVALALTSAGYRDEARRVVRFLLRLDLGAAARFHRDGTPVDGRAAQGDASGWIAVAARAAGVQALIPSLPWRDRADYQEGGPGDYLGNALASTAAEAKGNPAGDLSARRPAIRAIREDFEARGALVREAGNPGSGFDSAAAWAVQPFSHPELYPFVRRTLLRLAAASGRFGLVPSEDWDGGVDPWTAPTAWTAWSLAALGERYAALHLMAELRRAATPSGMLPERVDAQTGIPTSTTPLAWSHAFAILALRELWPGRAQSGRRQRPSQ
ncbi:MAG TPA: glycoside hydrolase family 15 protein [Solirubrobacterales bacterium]